jgi:hypothetical protein
MSSAQLNDAPTDRELYEQRRDAMLSKITSDPEELKKFKIIPMYRHTLELLMSQQDPYKVINWLLDINESYRAEMFKAIQAGYIWPTSP